MLPAEDQPLPVGVNGVKTLDGHVYFTSTTQEIFGRVPVDENASATGPVEILSCGFTPDDFLLIEDGTAYVTTNPQNELLKVTPEGNVHFVAGNQFRLAIGGSTAVAASRHDPSVLYVTTSGAQVSPIMSKTIEPAKIVAVKL